MLLLAAVYSFAGQIRTFVAPFAVTGTANKDELQVTLQNLLMSRLSNESIMTVDNVEMADINVKGSYVAFGKVFSIDSVAKSKDGKVLVRAFEQGESPEEMLQAVGKLAKTLQNGIGRNYPLTAVQTPAAVVAKEEPAAKAAAGPAIKPVAPPDDIVRAETAKKVSGATGPSRKLDGEFTGVALGRRLGGGEREVFVAGSHSLQYFRLGNELSLLSGVNLPVYKKVLGIDTADLDEDGIPEIYLTVMNGENLVSEVWQPEGNTLKQIGENLPYYFRAFSLRGGKNKIYVQQIGRDTDYYGDLYELTKRGAVFAVGPPLKLPKGANIFNTSMLPSSDGKLLFVVLSRDGYLLVFDESGKRLWASSDKYGGSENFFAREELQDAKVTGAAQRKVFLEQRLTVTSKGELIVPKNDGFFVVGNNRAYTKNSIFAFAWNGVMLDEIWHTKVSQNYLADYQYDEEHKELLLLEVVLKEGLLEKGASALSVKRVE
jgi:hypothetical protein